MFIVGNSMSARYTRDEDKNASQKNIVCGGQIE